MGWLPEFGSCQLQYHCGGPSRRSGLIRSAVPTGAARRKGQIFAYALIAFAWCCCDTQIAWAEKTLDLADLPVVPTALEALIKSADVTLETGDGDRRDPKLAAETHYQIKYSYSSRATWRIDPSGENLRISVRYLNIKWQPTHRVWFRRVPPTDGFWSNRLVLHEFDHVRISSDPRFARNFEKKLRDNLVLRRKTPADRRVDRRYVDELVNKHVKGVFQEVSDLVAIRYKELDRITNHGRQPLPPDSSIAEFLAEQNSDK